MSHREPLLVNLRYNISRPEYAILFAGFQAQGTLGRRIVDGAKTVRIFGEPYAVRALRDEIRRKGWNAQVPSPRQSTEIA